MKIWLVKNGRHTIMSYKIEDLQLKNFGMIENFQCNQFSNINLIIGEINED